MIKFKFWKKFMRLFIFLVSIKSGRSCSRSWEEVEGKVEGDVVYRVFYFLFNNSGEKELWNEDFVFGVLILFIDNIIDLFFEGVYRLGICRIYNEIYGDFKF